MSFSYDTKNSLRKHEGKTMIKCMSLFSQILSEMSSSSVSFEQLVTKHGNDCVMQKDSRQKPSWGNDSCSPGNS